MKNTHNSRIDTTIYKDYRYEDIEYHGLFYIGPKEKKRVKLDPKRYECSCRLTEDIRDIINKRKGPYYYPSKENKFDYECNVFDARIEAILNEWKIDFKPMMEDKLSKIKSREITAIDDYNFMCGITGPNSANANAMITNWKNTIKDAGKKHMLKTSFIAQFFHLTMSRVEAMAVASITRKGWKGERFNRDIFIGYAGKNMVENVKQLEGFKEYEQSYCIWNFIKHNSMSTYKKLKEVFPIILFDGEYKQGYLAINWIDFTEEVMIVLIQSIRTFYINYSNLVYEEDFNRAQWDHDEYFEYNVSNEIESMTNPLGLTPFDDFD